MISVNMIFSHSIFYKSSRRFKFLYLEKLGDAYDLEKIHITRMATNQKSFQKDKYYMDIEKYIINYSLKQNDYKQSFLRFSEERRQICLKSQKN